MNSQPSKTIFKDPKTKRIIITLGIAVLLLLISLIWQSMQFEKQVALKTQFIEEKNALRDDLDDLIDEHEFLKDEHSELNEQLFEKDSLINAYADDIKKLLRSENQLNEAKRKITRLKEISRKYISAIDSLLTMNATLVIENDSVKKANSIISSRNKKLEKTNQQLVDRVSVASILKAENIDVEGLYYRASGREVASSRANKIQNFRICFSISENKVAEAGVKELFIRIIAPDGTVLNVANQIQELALPDTILQYSFSYSFAYENQYITDCILWTRGNVLSAGDYRFELIVDNELIGAINRRFR